MEETDLDDGQDDILASDGTHLDQVFRIFNTDTTITDPAHLAVEILSSLDAGDLPNKIDQIFAGKDEMIRRAVVNWKYRGDFTPLHIAAKKNDLQSVEALLRYGAVVNAKNSVSLYITLLGYKTQVE